MPQTSSEVPSTGTAKPTGGRTDMVRSSPVAGSSRWTTPASMSTNSSRRTPASQTGPSPRSQRPGNGASTVVIARSQGPPVGAPRLVGSPDPSPPRRAPRPGPPGWPSLATAQQRDMEGSQLAPADAARDGRVLVHHLL